MASSTTTPSNDSLTKGNGGVEPTEKEKAKIESDPQLKPNLAPKSQVDVQPTSTQTQQNPLTSLGVARKSVLLVVFCLVQFLDAFNNSALFAAIPPIAVDLDIDNSTSVWLVSAYQLTFAALLLTSGQLSDIFNPKYIFVIGTLLMAISSLIAGFVRSGVALIILRALMGVGAALNIPSAMSAIVHLFPDPAAQSKALAGFAGAAAIGNVVGLIIGACLVSFASWPWVFYFVAIFGGILALVVVLLLPAVSGRGKVVSKYGRIKRLDIPGVSILTTALVLFIFAVTSGSIDGWRSAAVIAPLILSVFLTAGFFTWEARIPQDIAAVPPSIWKYPNLAILVAVSLQPFMWWASVQFLFSWYFQEVFEWSTIKTAVHFLPLGLVSFPVMGLASILQQRLPLKWVILLGDVLVLVGTVLFPFANSMSRFWRFAFPGFFIGTMGMTLVFATTNIALFSITPPEMSGVVGAIFSCALQLGSATGIAIITSIQTSIEAADGDVRTYRGRAAGFWFLFAFTVLETLAVLVFMRNTVPPVQKKKNVEDSEEGKGESENGFDGKEKNLKS